MNRTRTIVVAFSTLDGIIQDPVGSEGTAGGGWVVRNGPQAVAGDRFKLGPALDGGVVLLGRTTWEMFAKIFPSRTGEFDVAMTRVPKVVASRTLTDLSAFPNSALMDGDLGQAVEKQKAERDVIVMGSASVVHALAKLDLIDEYRIMFFSSAVGAGTRLFAAEAAPAHFRLASAETSGQEILARYERPDN
jgi:dihydrofolate reductase